jgi:Ferritin-like
MSDARDLMAVHPDDRDPEWLKKALTCAITLEHSTIPPYLCALWSIKSRANPIRKQILQVVVEEEMGHMALASNMLAALGGVPPIGDTGFVPIYPTQLPCKIRPIGNPNLVVGLEGFSVGLIANVFMAIEAPDTKPVPILAVHELALNVAKEDPGPSYPSIGKFYDAIRAAFEALGPAVTFPIDKQLSYQFSDPLNRVFPIANVADARNAIDQIREQGEGTPTSPAAAMSGKSKELAHYYQFEQIPRRKMFVQDGSGTWVEGPDLLPPPPATLYQMAPVPEGGYVNPPADVVTALKAFNDAYKEMLTDLKNAWVLGGGPGMAALERAIDRMSGRNGQTGLEDLAKAIFNSPIGTGPAVYGPTFEV